MNAVDEIQTAIDKLTEFKQNMSPGTWYASWDGQQYSVGSDDIGEIASATYTISTRSEHTAQQRADHDTTDFDLIVTLHRTIDAQLALLNEGATIAAYLVSPDEDAEIANFVALARAINGGA